MEGALAGWLGPDTDKEMGMRLVKGFRGMNASSPTMRPAYLNSSSVQFRVSGSLQVQGSPDVLWNKQHAAQHAASQSEKLEMATGVPTELKRKVWVSSHDFLGWKMDAFARPYNLNALATVLIKFV